jgi:hypothetical protein
VRTPLPGRATRRADRSALPAVRSRASTITSTASTTGHPPEPSLASGVAMVALARHGRDWHPADGMSRWLLSGIELFDWMALHRSATAG